MSISYSGTFGRSSGVISAIVKQIKLINLKPVKKIQVQFDPFHPKAITAREFLFHVTGPKVTNTNLNCIVKTNVVCDRSEPEIKINLSDSSVITFKAENLTTLEIFQLINKHISSKVPAEVIATPLTSKLEKKKLKKK